MKDELGMGSELWANIRGLLAVVLTLGVVCFVIGVYVGGRPEVAEMLGGPPRAVKVSGIETVTQAVEVVIDLPVSRRACVFTTRDGVGIVKGSGCDKLAFGRVATFRCDRALCEVIRAVPSPAEEARRRAELRRRLRQERGR